jgi:hypothetical protein
LQATQRVRSREVRSASVHVVDTEARVIVCPGLGVDLRRRETALDLASRNGQPETMKALLGQVLAADAPKNRDGEPPRVRRPQRTQPHWLASASNSCRRSSVGACRLCRIPTPGLDLRVASSKARLVASKVGIGTWLASRSISMSVIRSAPWQARGGHSAGSTSYNAAPSSAAAQAERDAACRQATNSQPQADLSLISAKLRDSMLKHV